MSNFQGWLLFMGICLGGSLGTLVCWHVGDIMGRGLGFALRLIFGSPRGGTDEPAPAT